MKDLLVGVIYGAAASTEFTFAVGDKRLRRLDYVMAPTPDGVEVLCQVVSLNRHSDLSHADAMAIADGEAIEKEEKVAAKVQVLGFRDERTLLQVPRVPFVAGTRVHWATRELILETIGLEDDKNGGAYVGFLKGTDIPVTLDIDTLVQKHVSILAKTGAGKSYASGVLLEELLKKKVPVVIVDAHNEYHSLANPNIEEREVDAMMRFGTKPKAFASQMVLFHTEKNLQPDGRVLKLEGINLEPNEIVEMAGSKLSGAQVGVLHQAVKEAKRTRPIYTLDDIVKASHANKSAAKWNVINALESLISTGLFAEQGVAPEEIVRSGKCTIVSLKGVPPDQQEVLVARLASMLFDARKAGRVPPFMFVVEEAHNYCPERGMGNSISGGIIRTVASEGRKFGMGLLVVSQRPAKVDKNVLSQCNTQIILKVTNPNDIRAISQSVEGITTEAAEELPRLPVGVAIVAGGSLAMPVLVEVRTRQSRHGGRSVQVVGAPEERVPAEALDAKTRDLLTDTLSRMPKGLPAGPDEAPEPAAAPVPTGAKRRHGKPPREPEGPEAESEGDEWSEEELPYRGKPLGRPADHGSRDRSITSGEDWVLVEGKPNGAKGPGDPPGSEPAWREPRSDPAELTRVDPARFPSRASTPSESPPSKSAIDVYLTKQPRDLEEERKEREKAIHRTAVRLGYVTTREPSETLKVLTKAAGNLTGVEPESYLASFEKIGRLYCIEGLPHCEICPMRAKCAFKARLDEQRREQGLLKRILGRRE